MRTGEKKTPSTSQGGRAQGNQPVRAMTSDLQPPDHRHMCVLLMLPRLCPVSPWPESMHTGAAGNVKDVAPGDTFHDEWAW